MKQLGCRHCRLAPECLDPHTLGLLWRQRELEIQALRCAIQNRGDARRGRILREVAGLPLERSVAKHQSPSPGLALTAGFCRTPTPTPTTDLASRPSPYLILIPNLNCEKVDTL